MNRSEFDAAVAAEQLRAFIDVDSARPGADVVAIRHKGSQWLVFVTDERRATVENSVQSFAEEAEALDAALSKLRFTAEAAQLMRRLTQRD